MNRYTCVICEGWLVDDETDICHQCADEIIRESEADLEQDLANQTPTNREIEAYYIALALLDVKKHDS